jgi:predicted 3-demethylubiquinone-9 3-methyltransferase (glyoxalase superfamily)
MVPSRRFRGVDLLEAYGKEISMARPAVQCGNDEVCLVHLERAHVLARRMTARHTCVHWLMWVAGWHRCDYRDVVGQVARTLAGAIRMRVPTTRWGTPMNAKNTICLWYDGTALEAAQFYAETFPDSAVGTVHRAPGDYPAGKEGDVLTVEFTVIGIPCLGLNGGPAFKHTEAFSFQVATDDQAETDRLWNAVVGHGGQESACGWCRDKWGLSWQITPRALTAAIADPDRVAARRAFEAMMTMGKIDIAVIEAARRG